MATKAFLASKMNRLRALNKTEWSRLLSIFFLLGILGSLPEVPFAEEGSAKILMLAVWFSVVFCLSSLIWFPSVVQAVWFLSVAVCLLAFLKLKTFYPLAMIVLWGLWYWVRGSRQSKN